MTIISYEDYDFITPFDIEAGTLFKTMEPTWWMRPTSDYIVLFVSETKQNNNKKMIKVTNGLNVLIDANHHLLNKIDRGSILMSLNSFHYDSDNINSYESFLYKDNIIKIHKRFFYSCYSIFMSIKNDHEKQ